MKIVVIGGTGLIGSKVVANLRHKAHEVATTAPANGVIELAGPDRIGLDDLVRRCLAAKRDTRKVVFAIYPSREHLPERVRTLLRFLKERLAGAGG